MGHSDASDQAQVDAPQATLDSAEYGFPVCGGQWHEIGKETPGIVRRGAGRRVHEENLLRGELLEQYLPREPVRLRALKGCVKATQIRIYSLLIPFWSRRKTVACESTPRWAVVATQE